MIEALKHHHQVGMVSWSPPDIEGVNRHYGTSIDPSDLTFHLAPAVLRRLVALVPFPSFRLTWAMVMMHARRLATQYDVLISADNEADLGRPGIQYVNFPHLRRPRPRPVIRWYHRLPFLMDLHDALFPRLLNVSVDAIESNRTLAVSQWTAEQVCRLYPNMETPWVVYPPVSGDFPDVPWERRENGFLCIGRFAPEKELEKAIDIVAAARRQIPDLHLHVIGGRESRSYYRQICRLATIHSDWLHLHEDLSRPELLDLISRHRYGIHGMKAEHFGIAPAEMVRGGCVVFVPNGGGQVEIVGAEDRLIYSTKDDAVEKIVRALSHPQEIASLRAHLATRRDLFSAERFMTAIRHAVGTFEGSCPYTADPQPPVR